MQIPIDRIDSIAIQNEMSKYHYSTAELLGTYGHPTREGADYVIRLYRAADALVFSTNGDAAWHGMPDFDALCAEYGVNVSALENEN